MEINKLDFAKIISDFMFLGIDNPEEKAIVVFKVKHQLTAHGFEKYMQYYFQIKKGYKVKLNGNTNQFDGGIDLKGIKVENGVKKYLVVQCKKYSIKDINENDISSYKGKTSHKYAKYINDTESYYITTSKFTDKAKKFAEEVGIKAIDFYHIYKLQKTYSIKQFEEDLKKKEGINEFNKSFIQDQLMLELNEQIYNTIGVTNKEVFELLKQVRRDYSYSKQLRLGDIARNDTLELLARKRPHNLQALKETISCLSIREKNKIMKHGNIFIDRLKYIHNAENKVTDEFEKGFFNKLIEFIR